MRVAGGVSLGVDRHRVEARRARNVLRVRVGEDHGAAGGVPFRVVIPRRRAVVAVAVAGVGRDVGVEDREHFVAHDAGAAGLGDLRAVDDLGVVVGLVVAAALAFDDAEHAFCEAVATAVCAPIAVGAGDLERGVGAAEIEGAFEDVLAGGVREDLDFDALMPGLAGGRLGVVGVKDGHGVVGVGEVHLERDANLARVADACGALGGLLRLAENGEEDRREDRDDCDDDEEFD